MKRLLSEQGGSAGVFSILTLLALLCSVGYTTGLADATLEKMRVQDAADAAAYSGARVRANLYGLMGFLNMSKLVLHRRALGCRMTEGQAAILMELGRISGLPVDPALLSDQVVPMGESVGDQATRWARFADRLQAYIEENFTDIITSEVRYVAGEHDCELIASAPGGEPAFEDETDHFRYWWSHFADLGRWTEYEVWACDIYRCVRDMEVEDYSVPPNWHQWMPGPPWTPRVISLSNDLSHARNAVHAVVARPMHDSPVLPGVLAGLHEAVVGTASAGCFSPTLNRARRHQAPDNLYTTDFRAELLSLESSRFRDWLEQDHPEVAGELPWVGELTVH